MPFIAYSPSPLLLRLGQKATSAYTDDTVVVVMAPSPILKERPHQLCYTLLVVAAKTLELIYLIKVVALPLTHSPAPYVHPFTALLPSIIDNVKANVSQQARCP